MPIVTSIAVVAMLASCSQDKAESTALEAVAVTTGSATVTASTDGIAMPLFASSWVLASAFEQGVPVGDQIIAGGGIRWQFIADGGCEMGLDCPDGPKLVGRDVCNDFTRAVVIGDELVTWGDYWHSTAAGCIGGLADTLDRFFRDESFRYVVADGQLQLSSSDKTIELTLTASPAN